MLWFKTKSNSYSDKEWLESQWVFRIKYLKPLLDNPLFRLLSDRNLYRWMLSGRIMLIVGFTISLGVFIFNIWLASYGNASSYWRSLPIAFQYYQEGMVAYLRLIGTIATFSCLAISDRPVFRRIGDFKALGFFDLINASPLGNSAMYQAVSMSMILPVFQRLINALIFTLGFLTAYILIAGVHLHRNLSAEIFLHIAAGFLGLVQYMLVLLFLIIIGATTSVYYRVRSEGFVTSIQTLFHGFVAMVPAVLIMALLMVNFPIQYWPSELAYLIILVLLIPGIIYNFATGGRAMERARRS